MSLYKAFSGYEHNGFFSRLGNMLYVTAETEVTIWDSITFEMTSEMWYYVTVTWHMEAGLILYINGLQVAQLDGKDGVPPVSKKSFSTSHEFEENRLQWRIHGGGHPHVPKSYVGTPWTVDAPSYGESWIRPWIAHEPQTTDSWHENWRLFDCNYEIDVVILSFITACGWCRMLVLWKCCHK